MSITSSAFRIALTAAALCAAASTADARPRRLVVLDFDGPRQLADRGRGSVLSALGDQYDVVATKRWEQARASAQQQQAHGPVQWSRAAKQAGVDAVIEGWVQDEGRRKILNIVVRDASNGREFDTITVRLDGSSGMSSEGSKKLQANLDEVLEWIEPGDHEPAHVMPVVSVKKLGKSKSARSRAADAAEADAAHDAADDAVAEAAPASQKRAKRPADEMQDDVDPVSEPVAEPAVARAPAPLAVSTATREENELEILFPQNSDERKQILGEKVDRPPQKTARFMVDAGGYYGSRSLTFDAAEDSTVPAFAGVTTKGFEVNMAAYPFPLKDYDGILSGVGFTGKLHHSAGSSVEFDLGDEIQTYVINQNGWELAAHYRTPITGLVAFDGGAFYGNQTYQIVDAVEEFETPDTSYSYLGAGLKLDLFITERASVGFGARYFWVLDSGDLESTDFFGPSDASGLGLEGSFLIPLPQNLYVRGDLTYQKISHELGGGGIITDEDGVLSGKDSLILGHVNLGISF